MNKRIQILILLMLFLSLSSFFISVIQIFKKEENISPLKISSLSMINKPGILRLYLEGEIHNDPYTTDGIYAGEVLETIDMIKKSSYIKGVLIALNSPGGSVGPTKRIFDALFSLRNEKPVVVYITDMAASGGYYIASAADKIVAYESAIVGSIGVILIRPNIQPLLENLGISIHVFKSGKYKDMGHPFREITEDEKKMYDEILETAYANFINDVATGRKQSLRVVQEEWAEGRIFSGKKAKANQMIDETGGEETALQILKMLLKTTEDLPVYELQEDAFKKWLRMLEMHLGYSGFARNRIFLPEIYYLYGNSSFLKKYYDLYIKDK